MFDGAWPKEGTLPSPCLRDTTASLLHALRLAIVCSTLLAIQGFYSSSEDLNAALTSQTMSSSTSGSDMWVFPNASYSNLENASQLADFLSSRLSSGSTYYVKTAEDSYGLPFRNPYAQNAFFDSYLLSEPSVVFLSGDGSVFRLFYNQVSASIDYSASGSIAEVRFGQGMFLGFSAILSDSTIYAGTGLQYVSSVREVAESLGVPAVNLTIVSTLAHEDTTTIVLSSLIYGYTVAGCNIVSAEFQTSSGRLVAFQSRPFLVLPDELTISKEKVLDIARTIVPSYFKDHERAQIISDEVIGVRAQPFYDLGTSGPASDNLSLPGETGLRFRFGYEYVANISSDVFSTNYPVLVVVDISSGMVILSEREPTPTPSERGLLMFLDGWNLAFAASLISLGVIALVLLGPPELAIVLLGVLVPLRVRLSNGMDVLDNFNRGRIFEHVKHHPGCSFSELKAGLRLHNGSLAYHLAILERLGLIKSLKDGWARRYSVQGAKNDLPLARLLGSTEGRVLKVLASKGPLIGTEVARELGISRQRAHYNLRRLLKRGLVERSDSGWVAVSGIAAWAESTNESSNVN